MSDETPQPSTPEPLTSSVVAIDPPLAPTATLAEAPNGDALLETAAETIAADPGHAELVTTLQPETTEPTAAQAGPYRVVHGSFVLDNRDVVGPGGVVQLTSAEAEAALADQTVERL
jgi:hypothetical protein